MEEVTRRCRHRLEGWILKKSDYDDVGWTHLGKDRI
jgi:hypothetical protein